MNIQELKEKLKAANLHPIHLEGDSPIEDIGGNKFIGNLDEYIEAARALGAPAVLFFTRTLQEETFYYKPDIDIDELEVEVEPIDLRKCNPMLKACNKYVGQVGMFKLSASNHEANFSFYIKEDWWREFESLWIETASQINDEQEADHAQVREQYDQKQKQVLKALHGLIADEEFIRLRTQISMIEYAKDKIPDLEFVDPLTLKSEMQSLRAKIEAKGLRKKRGI